MKFESEAWKVCRKRVPGRGNSKDEIIRREVSWFV
jgi:hypothetical protein